MAFLSPVFSPVKHRYESLFSKQPEAHELFRHERLLHPAEDVRLVRISTDAQKKLEYEVQTFPLGACPQYCAVSYARSRTARTKYISLNGRYYGVSKTVLEFLQQADAHMARNNWDAEWLWIDAICVNQDDLEERRHHVTNAKRIWEDANSVVSWLGREADESHQTPQLVEQVKARSLKIGGSHLPPDEKPFNRQQWTLLAKFIDRAWWTRSRTVLEATNPHPSSHSVWCGEWTLPFADLSLLMAKTDSSQIVGSTFFTPWLHESADPAWHTQALANWNSIRYRALEAVRVRRQHEARLGPLTIYDFLWQMRTQDCADPRDRIYTFLSLAQDGQDPELQADYSLPVVEVYRFFTGHVILRDRSLDILTACSFDRKLKVPSWVPDWTAGTRVPHPFSLFRVSSKGDPASLYRASGSLEPDIRIIGQGLILRVKGVMIDKIRRTSQAVDTKYVEDPRQLGQQWRDMAASHRLNNPGESGVKALEHILCADAELASPDNPFAVRGNTITIPRVAPNKFNDNFLIDHTVGAVIPWYRRLFTTSKHEYMGIATRRIQRGDMVCLLFGAQMPMILRREGDRHVVIGPAYIHNIMDGEALAKVDVERQATYFEIV